MKTKTGMLLKGSMMLPLGALLMGNQSCEKQTVKVRELKKIVEMGRIASPALVIPGVGAFDFQFVANQQVYGVLSDSEGFALRYLPPVTEPVGNLQGKLNLTSADAKMFSKINQAATPQVVWSKEASCMVNLPMARMQGSVNAFEMIGGGGLTLGFNPSGAHAGLSLGSLGFNLEYAQLDVSMIATRPLTGALLQAMNVNSTQTKTKINASINLGMFSLGPSFYYQTPLAKVTKAALEKAVTGLKDKLSTTEPWYTRVMANHDTHLTVIGGRNVNLEAGDELAVYNETYYWDGEPCASTYRGGAGTTPVAVIRVESVGDEISIGKVIKQSDENAVIGAKVKLHKFHAVDYVAGDGTGVLTDVQKP